jgi:hypothetical protein
LSFREGDAVPTFIPDSVTYGKVKATFITAVGDGQDEDETPDFTGAEGTVVFTPSVPTIQAPTAQEPVTIWPAPVECKLVNGVLTDPQGREGVWLIATQNPALIPVNWNYVVTVSLKGFGTSAMQVSKFDIQVAANGLTDLSAKIPPSGEGTPLTPTILQRALDAHDGALLALGAARASAAEAGAFVASAEEQANAAKTAAIAAGDALTGALAAKTATDTIRTGAQSAKVAAETARTAAEAARDAALAQTFAGVDVGTASLNTLVTPGLYRQSSTANATTTLGYPIEGSIGSIEVVNAGGLVFQRLTSHLQGGGRSIFVRRSLAANGSSWGSWREFASQRVDKTAGIAIYAWDSANGREQLTYGDTGWRDVTSLLVNGYTADQVLVRRTTWSVTWKFINLSGAAATSVTCLPAIAGFMNTGATQRDTGRGFLFEVSTSTVRRISNHASGMFFAAFPFAGQNYGEVSLSIDAPWPTALPGTASGAIPNA